MDPKLLAGDARCSPTSSRWALSSPMTRTRLGCGRRLSGERCGGCGAIGGKIVPPPPTHVSLDTARSDKHKTSKMEERGGGPHCLESGCIVAYPAEGWWLQIGAPRRWGTDMRPHRRAGCRPGLTGRHQTKDSICPEKKRGNAAFQGGDRRCVAADGAATKHRGGGALPYRGGSGDRRLRASRRTATPTDSRILAKHSYEFPTLGPGAISRGRGDEEPKGKD